MVLAVEAQRPWVRFRRDQCCEQSVLVCRLLAGYGVRVAKAQLKIVVVVLVEAVAKAVGLAVAGLVGVLCGHGAHDVAEPLVQLVVVLAPGALAGGGARSVLPPLIRRYRGRVSGPQ